MHLQAGPRLRIEGLRFTVTVVQCCTCATLCRGSVSKALMAFISRLEGAGPSGDAGPSNRQQQEDDAR